MSNKLNKILSITRAVNKIFENIEQKKTIVEIFNSLIPFLTFLKKATIPTNFLLIYS